MPRIVRQSEPQRAIELPRIRRHADGELRATLMGRLVAVSDLLRNTKSVESAASAVGRAALMLTGASRGAIFLRMPNGVVACPWSHNLSDDYISRLCTPPDANPWAHLSHYPELECMDLSARGRARTVAPSIIEDVRTLPSGNEVRRAAEHEGVRALCSWPVGRKGRVFAAIAYYFDAPHTVSDPEREVALAFTLQAAATLEHAMTGEKQGPAPARSGGLFGGIVFGKRHIDRGPERADAPPPGPAAPADGPRHAVAPVQPDVDAAAHADAGAEMDAEGGLEVETVEADSDVEADGETGAAHIAALQRALETEAGRLWSERTNLGVEREQVAAARGELDAERERLAEMRHALEVEQGRVTEMQNALAAESVRTATARGELEAEQARMAALRKTFDAERAQLETARRSVDAEREKVTALRRETETAVKQLTAARTELEAERTRLAAQRAELQAKEAQLEEFRRDLEDARAGAAAELERERTEVLSVQGNFTAAQAEIAQRRSALEEENARLAQARREIDADRDRLASLVHSLQVGGPVAAEAVAAAATALETAAPAAPPAPHREVGMVPPRDTPASSSPDVDMAPPREGEPATPHAVAPWASAAAPRPLEMSKAAGPAQAAVPLQTMKSGPAAKAVPAAKPVSGAKPAPVSKPSVPKPAAPKPSPAPRPAKPVPAEPQPASVGPIDPATAQKYRERIAQWATAAARALACNEQDIANLKQAAMLYEVDAAHGAAPAPAVADILSHVQEQWNGKGGPNGLAGDEIPLGARILAVTIAYAEMVIGRPGSPMLYYLDAKAALKRGAGSKYDPDVIKAFCRVVNRT
jgi:predicted  nucleic acid-binding Zn-ribbon protein